MAEDENDKNMILCECKWGGFLVTAEEVDVHQKKVKLVGEPENFQYIFFRPGFTAEAMKKTKKEFRYRSAGVGRYILERKDVLHAFHASDKKARRFFR